MDKLTLKNIEKWDKKVASDAKYGKEQELIEQALVRYPKNTDIVEVAMKISLIDLTNSTQLTNYKSKLSLYDIAEIILNITDFDKRVSEGDESLVTEIASKTKDFNNGNGVNLFSFASKYCCYHNIYAYHRDDYSIFDNVVSANLYQYATKKLPLRKTDPEKWRVKIQYKEYNDYIDSLLEEYGIPKSVEGRRRMFDHFLWFAFR